MVMGTGRIYFKLLKVCSQMALKNQVNQNASFLNKPHSAITIFLKPNALVQIKVYFKDSAQKKKSAEPSTGSMAQTSLFFHWLAQYCTTLPGFKVVAPRS